MEEKQKNDKRKEDPIYSETAYDDAFKTMEARCDDVLIPFVNHMFNENYGKDAIVKHLRNEQFIEQENAADEKRITDSHFEITYKDITRKYHLECESKKFDGSILVRIFEYDSEIALATGKRDMRTFKVRFPNSGLLLLRTTGKAPDTASIEIEMPNGEAVSYNIPIIKMSDISIDMLFEQHLYMLIPFFIFTYEERLSDINDSEESINSLLEVYEDIFNRLDKELENGNLSALSHGAIIKLTYSVAYKLTMKKAKVQKKVGDFMGGKMLDLPEFKIYDQGKADGLAEGEAKGKSIGEAERKELKEENDKLRKELEELKKKVPV